MIYKLQENEYKKLQPLFQDLRYNLVVDSVIAGNTPAWVYADHPRQPQTALIWNRQDAMLIAGVSTGAAVNVALAELITAQFIPDAQRRYIPELSLHYAPAAWERQIETILAGHNPQQARRRYYPRVRLKIDWESRLPPGWEMKQLDQTLLQNAALQNRNAVAGWINSFWPSQTDFLRTGFGFCLFNQETIASWCLSVYVSGQNYELGLATDPAYRNQGFATLTAAACVDHCLAHGWQPHWHCWEDNVASIAVAEKVGFEAPVNYTVYRFGI